MAADLLSRHAWTHAELRRRLVRRGAPRPVADAVVDDLTARKYVDDAAFARHWVDTRGGRGYGPARLRAELRARGVAAPLIEQALVDTTRDTDVDRARAVAAKRLPSLRRAQPARAATRLRNYLLRRGYAPSIVMRVVKEAIGTTPED